VIWVTLRIPRPRSTAASRGSGWGMTLSFLGRTSRQPGVRSARLVLAASLVAVCQP
jgi:hypothetical protein